MKHLFFDWDRTLWHFDKNSALALKEIFHKKNLQAKFTSFESFYEIYQTHNHRLWNLYREGKIEKEDLSSKRFSLTFEQANITDKQFAQDFSEEYLQATTTKTELFPNAKECLLYLKSKYKLHIITNGFVEVQYLKIKNSGLAHFFSEIITSEEAGALKPHPKIFEFALSKTGAKLENSVLIGDDLEADIKGAINFGMKNIFFNPNKVKHKYMTTHEIRDLLELTKIL